MSALQNLQIRQMNHFQYQKDYRQKHCLNLITIPFFQKCKIQFQTQFSLLSYFRAQKLILLYLCTIYASRGWKLTKSQLTKWLDMQALQNGLYNIMLMNSELGDCKTESKRQIEKMELYFEDNIYQERKFKLKFFPWIRTGELKKILVKERYNHRNKHLTQNDIRLFCKNIELTHENKNVFDFYKIEAGSTVVIMKNANSNNLQNGVINPYQIFQQVPPEITSLILNVQSGLNSARKPRLAQQGTSGTYFLENNKKKIAAVYKPYDQEPYTPNNPRGYAGELGTQGIRKGILSGECATRQVAAYLLDSINHFHEVPATTYIQFYHPCFSYKELCQNTPILSNKQTDLKKQKTKHGSLQEFVQYFDVVGNLGSHQFDVNEVHKIAILDLRILNCDRNEANILVVKKMVTNAKGTTSKITNLIPIDHGLTFPDNLEIYDHQIVWMTYKQVHLPLSKKSLEYISRIDPAKDCQTLRLKLGFRQICLRNFRIAQIYLKRMASAGFSPYEIGTFAYRVQDSDCDDSDGQVQQKKQKKKNVLSQLQKLVKQTQVIYFAIKDNGIKPTVELQIGLIKLRQSEEQNDMNQLNLNTRFNSQQENLQLGLINKYSRNEQSSIQKIQTNKNKFSRTPNKTRNISLPNLKNKTENQNKNRIIGLKKKKNKTKKYNQVYSQHQKWGEVFFHYFEAILERFVKKQVEAKEKKAPTGRGRFFSEYIQ